MAEPVAMIAIAWLESDAAGGVGSTEDEGALEIEGYLDGDIEGVMDGVTEVVKGC
jgi:hypothetical protein